jgi:chemotaxis signal transduction protein
MPPGFFEGLEEAERLAGQDDPSSAGEQGGPEPAAVAAPPASVGDRSALSADPAAAAVAPEAPAPAAPTAPPVGTAPPVRPAAGPTAAQSAALLPPPGAASATPPLAGSEPQLIVSVGGVLYALPIGGIEEILPMREVAPLPRSSAAVRGILFLRGHPVTVIDLGILLDSGPVPGKRIVVFRVEGEHYGLVVDEVHKVAEPGSLTDAVPPPPALGAPPGVRGVARLADEIVSILDIERLIPVSAGPGGIP